jgi:formate hydrogenlyase subunit 5
VPNLVETVAQVEAKWPGEVEGWVDRRKPVSELRCHVLKAVPQVAKWLVADLGYHLAGVIAEEHPEAWEIRYLFYQEGHEGWTHLVVRPPLKIKSLPSITPEVHAADWHEREVEDLFGITFEGHPLLGDFILHNDLWQETVSPMRRAFDPQAALPEGQPDSEWRPRMIVEGPGAFAMPVGPVYSGATESVQFLLETVGEDVIRMFPRLFYKFRGIEKIAEGKRVDDCLLLAERFAATTAFAHAWAFCQAVESIDRVRIPPRAQVLRILLAELERFRHHAGVIHDICESTGLAVAASQAAILEEDLLRICGALTGHRYLFGVVVPGGLTRDLDDSSCLSAIESAQGVLRRLEELDQMLRYSSSFLDRLEGVGIVTPESARQFGLVGPIARASGFGSDLRKAQPYGAYERLEFDVPTEKEGDGFARLRILFAECTQAVRIMAQLPRFLEAGPVTENLQPREGVALGWTESPRGAAFHWLRLGPDGLVKRLRLITPSFVNWHGFHLAAEKFAFQDFPIILATFGLSVAENDR